MQIGAGFIPVMLHAFVEQYKLGRSWRFVSRQSETTVGSGCLHRQQGEMAAIYWIMARRCVGALSCLLLATTAVAAEHHGRVLSNSLPVPGARITATRDGQSVSTVSDARGAYEFADLPDGVWKIAVAMRGFASMEQDVTVAAGASAGEWNLKMLPLEQIVAQAAVVQSPTAQPAADRAMAADKRNPPIKRATTPAMSKPAETSNEDGLVLNGSTNNGDSSPFSFLQAFGNARKSHRIYNGGMGFIFGNSVLDAQPYSITGLATAQPNYNQATALASFGGPLRIPHLLEHNAPDFAVTYQWTRNANALAQSGLMPTAAQRMDTVDRVDPVARALLALYPLPNMAGNASYNYQIPVLNDTHTDALQTHLEGPFKRVGFVSGAFSLQSTRSEATNLFGFRDETASLGLNSSVSLAHYFGRSLSTNITYSFSRLRTAVTPYFADRINISGEAGITGNLQDARDWGPPMLVFSSGISSLTDAQSADNRNQTDAVGGTAEWYHGQHDITAGGNLRRIESNYRSQQDPRGTFTFTGAAFGSDFADFLHGVPDTAAIVYGNADKYLRQSTYDLYAADDWRVASDLTFNVGIRWEYDAPLTELKNRLANLDVLDDFSQVTPVTAQAPTGSLTGQTYPNSLLRPDRSHIEPRLAFSWRPIAGDSTVVRASYGVYADTSVYPNIALQLAQQAPFSKSISANNSICAQSLEAGPKACSTGTADTFGIDPNFRTGYAQIWQFSMQHDLPSALQMTATYLGVHGLDGTQQFLPNTYALGATDPCPDCPSGFVYRTSSGSSSRQSGTLLLRRRLRSGFTASLQYTYSKSIDDDAVLGGQGPMTGGATSATVSSVSTAQNWKNLKAERGLSTFDQRHLLQVTVQYTTGMGLGGGTLSRGWLGRAYKEWTLQNVYSAGTGLPQTPVYLAAVNGTGFSGSLRPDRTPAPLYLKSAGRYLNPAAFAAPHTGEWGNAGRDSIIGPKTFTWNSSLGRTFRLSHETNLDIRVDATNVLNHAVFSNYNVTIDPSQSNPLFGIPSSANAMRNMQITTRWRF